MIIILASSRYPLGWGPRQEALKQSFGEKKRGEKAREFSKFPQESSLDTLNFLFLL